MESNSFHFAAIRGVQAGKAYYTLMCPLKLVSKLFRFDDDALSPELRAQRILNHARVPAIKRYIVEHPSDYILSSLCASVDGEIEFEPYGDEGTKRSIGVVSIGMTSTILINDGQHRRAAIEEAIKERPELGDESVSVVVFVDCGLQRSQQMFADLNVHAVKPTKSLNILYDHRDAFSTMVKEIVQAVPLFRQFTDFEKTSISNRSIKLFTLSAIHQATALLLGKHRSSQAVDEDKKLAIEFWNAVIQNMPDWQAIERKSAMAHELRRDYIHAHGVTLQAIANAGTHLISRHPKDWAPRLQALRGIDWSRSNVDLWQNRALVGAKINKAKQNVQLVSNTITIALGLQLTSEGEQLERSVFGTVNSVPLKSERIN